jgi:hypothetical protein
MDLTKYKENPKTAFLAQEYERLSARRPRSKAWHRATWARSPTKIWIASKKPLCSRRWSYFGRGGQRGGVPQRGVLEVRAGVGGQEAALFAEELAHMYQGYAEVRRAGASAP